MNSKLAQELIQKTNQYYERNADTFSASRNRDWQIFLSLLHYIKSHDIVLDLGCGNGRLYPLIKQKGAEYLGIDSSKKLLKTAQKIYPQANFIHGDILSLIPDSQNLSCHHRFPARNASQGSVLRWRAWRVNCRRAKNSITRNSQYLKLERKFNAIFSIAALHHIPSKKLRQQTFSVLAAHLAPQGYLLLTNWNLFQYRFLSQRLKNNFLKLFGINKMELNDILFKGKRFYHGFSKREIASNLKKAGFAVIENYYEKNGKKSNRFFGANLITIARKKA